MEKIDRFLRKIARPSLNVAIIILIILFGWILWETYQADNFGFASKTFWDWMELLVIPIVLAIAGYWFSHTQRQSELETAAKAREVDREIAEKEREADRDIALERQRQQTLENYLDRMKELLLDRNLGPKAEPEVQTLARTWTLNVLRELTAKRNRQVILFLQESDLLRHANAEIIKNASSVISFHNANLSHTDLAGVDLSRANMENATLIKANLNEAILSRAALIGANLESANLDGAMLDSADLCWGNFEKANLQNAILQYARMEGANLTSANLKYAFVTGEQLRQTRLSDTTFMPDGSTYKEWKQKNGDNWAIINPQIDDISNFGIPDNH